PPDLVTASPLLPQERPPLPLHLAPLLQDAGVWWADDRLHRLGGGGDVVGVHLDEQAVAHVRAESARVGCVDVGDPAAGVGAGNQRLLGVEDAGVALLALPQR